MKKSLMSFLLLSAMLITVGVSAQQLKVPAPSPLQTIKQVFALSDISIEYSRPGVKGRTVFGDLVPYGKVWRTGANSATKITFGEDVSVEGKPVKAGTYALYTIPGKDMWTIMLYKDLTLGGDVNEYKAENEVMRADVKSSVSGVRVETFTVNVVDIASNACSIQLSWDNVSVNIGVKADIEEKIMKNIQTAMFEDKRPYYQAANYYYENGKDLKQALEWVNKATDQNPSAYWVFLLKAKIELKQKDYSAAAISAQKVIDLATADKDDTYVGHGQKILDQTKSGK